ncbi:cupin domain-containing protein [Bifidobacterium simiarum]|uniref:cupin domain-containing protein n=1 Tax=Bifidobacterium simiarum TaxID=2045441 RepID=UPI001BDBCDCF|nr:cupin domain-containing protein [Bifidobacterium simiarum]MBT1166216.1 cupin domain-containing protein [Bifidobacterium simiarum]
MASEDNGTSLAKPAHDTGPLSGYAKAVIAKLGLEPHPEGGWYRRDWQSPTHSPESFATATAPNLAVVTGNRPLASLIYFLLPAGDFSDWHQVDADEIWLWHGPGTVTLELAGDGSSPDVSQSRMITLGSGLVGTVSGDLDNPCLETVVGHAVVPAGTWQRTVPGDADALVSCVVSPGFTFEGFTLADR